MRSLDAPPEIASDLALQQEAFALFADSIDGNAEARAELNRRAAEFDAADEKIEPFMRDVCGVDFGD